jgi:hypothetical protein
VVLDLDLVGELVDSHELFDGEIWIIQGIPDRSAPAASSSTGP